ncbi:hypothetical protein ACRB8A_12225 [Arthrobacter sp. G.S.26]
MAVRTRHRRLPGPRRWSRRADAATPAAGATPARPAIFPYTGVTS